MTCVSVSKAVRACLGRIKRIYSLGLWIGGGVFGQVQMTSTEPTLTVCGAAGTVQVVIQNTGGATLTGVSLQAVFPTGISYVGGSVSSVPAGATEIGPGQFALPDILAGQTLQVTFSIQAGCDILPLLGDPNAHIRNTYTLSWAGGGSFTLTSADYTILEPALQYASITNQVYNAPGVGVTFSRVFTVANVGSGALAAFTHRETWGNCVQVVSVTGGQVVSQTVSELILSFGAPDFGPNGLFDPGETVTFTVTYRVVCCTNLSSTFQLRWGCNGQICRTVAATGGVTVPGGTPNLQGQHRWLTESSCYGPAVPAGANRMRLRLWNSGTGPARNIQVVLQGVNGRDALHVPSVAVQFPTGGAVPFVIINQSSHTGCFLGVGGMALSLTLELQADLQPGQEVWIEADGYTCPPPSCNSNSNNIHTELRNFSWRINYQSACGQSYTAQGTSRTRTYYPSPMSLSVPCIPRQGTATLVVQVERGPGIFILTPDGFASSGTPSSSDYAFRWELAMPPCYAIVGQPVWYGPDPANPGNLLAWSGSVVGTSVVFTEATRPANWNNSSFTNSFLHIPLTSACQPPGGTPSCVVFSGAIPPAITVTGYYNPNTTCNAPDWCFSAPRGARILTCPDPTDCNGGIIICPDPNNCPPPFEGIFFADFSFKRVSYGLPDNNQDGLPDPAGGLDFSRIRVQAGMATDTVEAYYEGVIAKPTGGGWPTAWAILGFQPSGGNVTLQPLQLNVRLKKASTGQVYTLQVDGASLASLVQTFPSCQGGSCVTGFEVDLRTSSLQALLPGFPSLYEHGDSLKIWLSARIEQVGTTVEVVASVQPCLYVTDEVSPSPHTSAFSCGIYGENFTFVGHFFDFYQGSNPFISSGCGGAQIELISRFRPKGFTCGGNVFPYEYRPWSFPESLEVELPTGWVYEVGSGQVTFGRTSGVTCTNTSVALDPTNPAGPLLEFPLFTLFPAGGGAWVIADDEYTVRVRFRVRPTCGVPANGSFLRASITHDGRLSYRGRINPFSPNLQMNPPVQLQVQPVVNPIVADQATLTWTLEIRNPSNAIAAPNVFLYLQAGAGQVVVTSVEEVGVGPIPLSNDHYRLGNIAPGVVRRFLIKATLSGCMPDTLWAVVGWDCQGYPVQAAGFPCLDYRVPLSYILQSPNPIMTFSAAPNPHDLCTEVTIETQITNAGTAYFYGALVTLQLPPNLSYVSGSGEVAYPASGVFVPLPNPTPSPGGLIWDLEALVPGLANGWPYQGSGASLRLRYRVASQCGYISGRGVRQVLSYRNVCQQTLYKTAAVPIQLNIPPALAPYSTQISTPDQTVGSCVSTLSVCVTITQQGPGISGVGDQVWVVLPPGFGYVPGSTTGLGNQDPTITQSNGLTYLSWPFPAGVASGQGVNFCFTLTPPASAGSYSLLIQTTAPSMLTCGAGPCQTQIPTGAHTLQVQLLDIQPVLQSTNVLCAGAAQGSITLSFNGPLPPGTTWQWSGPGGFSAGAVQNLTNLVAGTYTLQINAPGCPPITRQVILSEPPPLQLTLLQLIHPLCFGSSNGSIKVEAAGGVGPYEYSIDGGTTWDPTGEFLGLGAGTYTVIAKDAHNCTVSLVVTLQNPPQLVINNPVIVPPSCRDSCDGAITIKGVGGTRPYTYRLARTSPSVYVYPDQADSTFRGLCPGTYTLRIEDANGCVRTRSGIVLPNPPLLSLSLSSSGVSCAGAADGTITATATGGVGPAYSFSIDGGVTFLSNGTNSYTFSGLSGGTYTITVRDANGCRRSGDITVSEPTALALNAPTVVDVRCNGGMDGSITVNVVAGSGTAPYEYSLNGGPYQASATFTGLSAGSYTVTVRDANGCTISQVVTVGQPATALALDPPTVVDVRCNGGSDGSITVNVVAGSGTAPYEYSLNGGPYQASPTFTGLSAGSYTVTVRDANGCTISQVVTVGQPTGLALNAPTVVDVRCNGGSDGSITVNVVAGSGTAPYEYSLNGGPYQASPTFTGLSAGSYTVTVRDANGCTISQVVTVGQPTALALNAPTVVDVRCNGGSDGSITVNVVAGSGTAPYEYSLNGGPYQASPTFTGLSAGSYTVTVRDANGCTISQVVTVGQPTGLALNAPTVVDVRCNGGSDGSITVNVVAGSGTAPYEYSLNGGPYQASPTFTGLSAGSYTVTVRDANGCTISQVVTVGQPYGVGVECAYGSGCSLQWGFRWEHNGECGGW
ncbi:MAG: hypothetical protein KatS3mg025_0519 [Bacteroidia bacterium]|nr:MAG: hypothetical protein KatS3mg025_0519 [Bacteroidia bacterium]